MKALLLGVGLSALIGCHQAMDQSSSSAKTVGAEARAVVDAAIAAHGGHAALEAASTWVAEIRRHQRGDSYVVTSYYMPGMVRMESDLGNGERSADVIGDPHCWGMQAPVSLPCSPETRENDRPRVIMEMASQLWPLVGEDWLLLGAETVEKGGDRVELVTAHYLPRDTEVQLTFDGATHMLRSMSVRGIKEGVEGKHLHTYSHYQEYCGVKMPARNEKSFEGSVWVAEEVLELSCRPLEESLFVRPPQIAEGTIVLGDGVLSIFTLQVYDEGTSTLEEKLRAQAMKRNLRPTGPLRFVKYDNDGMGLTGELVVELQLPVEDIEDEAAILGEVEGD